LTRRAEVLLTEDGLPLEERISRDISHIEGEVTPMAINGIVINIAKHTKVDMIWVAGRSPTLVSQNLKATTLTYLAIT
jgi:hypothetical protein